MRTPGGLIIPSNVTSVRVPKFRCAVCKMDFTREEAYNYELHVGKCIKRNEDRLRNKSIREQLPGLYGPEAGDPEYEAWVRRHGRVK